MNVFELRGRWWIIESSTGNEERGTTFRAPCPAWQAAAMAASSAWRFEPHRFQRLRAVRRVSHGYVIHHMDTVPPVFWSRNEER